MIDKTWRSVDLRGHKCVTLKELQNVYESILNIKIDRRNFRKKMLSVIVDTGKEIKFAGKKKAKLYKFDKKKKDISIF